MTMINAYVDFWKGYVDFKGKTKRADFWWAVLADLIVGVVLGVLVALVSQLSFLSYIYGLATLVPTVAICIRRLRDIAKPWPYIFLALIPVVGWIIMVVLFVRPSAK